MARKKKRILFGDESGHWSTARERDVFPAPVRPVAVRLLWLGLLLVLTGLAVLLVLMGRTL
ncbi:hypothetical protein OG943_19710 [Amycolatopsis sp. NBC_00345]|uniref:hypothetical protein n=1 Tax=Amycolatopsis sp. NBC_00345 TaxID=2975955 RepID=UPI002E25E6EE